MKHEVLGIVLSALVVVAMAAQAAVCPLGSQPICAAATLSSTIFGLLGLVCLGSCIALYIDRKNNEESNRKAERTQQDG